MATATDRRAGGGAVAGAGSSALARPKSRTFTVPSSRTLMLAGFRSRWTTPASWAPCKAKAICHAMDSTSSNGIGPLDETVGQGRALDQLQDQRARAAGLLEAVNLGDVRVVQRGEDAGLALEARQPVRVGGERLGQHLQRDVATELRVASAVDLAHAAGAEWAR